MEGYLDLTMFALLNLKEMQWPEYEINCLSVSNYLTYAVFGLCCSAPIFLFLYACFKRKKWEEKNFQNRYGAYLDGMNQEDPDSVKAVLFLSILFFARRMSTCLTIVFWQEFFWGQVALECLASQTLIILIQWARPLDSKWANNFETFNEVMTLFVLYILMCFSDYVPDPQTRNLVGFSFIALLGVFVGVHLVPIFGDTFSKLHRRCKRCYVRRC